MELLPCLLGIPVLLLAWMAISPRGMWQTLSAWQFKNPEANEPSEAAYAANRVVAVVGIVVLISVGCWVMSAVEDSRRGNQERDRDQQERDYQECLDEHADDEDSLDAWCGGMSPDPLSP
ncbi:MAG: hypothetical protein ACRDUA_15290 [Micromonosporaceae bacterium]